MPLESQFQEMELSIEKDCLRWSRARVWWCGHSLVELEKEKEEERSWEDERKKRKQRRRSLDIILPKVVEREWWDERNDDKYTPIYMQMIHYRMIMFWSSFTTPCESLHPPLFYNIKVKQNGSRESMNHCLRVNNEKCFLKLAHKKSSLR